VTAPAREILYREELDVLVKLLEASIARPPDGLLPQGTAAQFWLLDKLVRMRDSAPGVLAS